MAGVGLEDAPPPASEASPQMFNNPVLQPGNLITVARTAFGPGQVQRLAPSILENFDTKLSQADITERLHFLWSMRHDVATQVRDIILLGQVRQKPSAIILNDLLDLTELYTRDTY